MKPTFVLVVGSWHTTAYYDPLVKALADAGYPSVAVTPRCLDSFPPATSFQPDANALKDVIAEVSGDKVIVMHSYGGMVGTEVVGGLVANQPEVAESIKWMVYLAAFAPLEGENLLDAFQASPVPPPEPYFEYEDGYMILKDNAVDTFYHDVLEPDRSWYASLLGKQPAGVNDTPASHLGYEHVNSTFIFTTQDRAMKVEYQEWAVERARARVREKIEAGEALTEPFAGPLGQFSVDSGHCGMISKPEEFAGILGKIAEGSRFGSLGAGGPGLAGRGV